MGRMKATLGDDLPTIGDSRREGMTTFSIHCAAPCRRVSKVQFDALRLPDSTFFVDIPKKRRLVCKACGRRASEISANWNEVVAHGNGKRRLNSWVVVARAPDGVEVRSSAVVSRDAALGLAFDMADAGDTILRIEGPMGDVLAEEIAAERAARPIRLARGGQAR